jgi:hypothetical protein
MGQLAGKAGERGGRALYPLIGILPPLLCRAARPNASRVPRWKKRSASAGAQLAAAFLSPPHAIACRMTKIVGNVTPEDDYTHPLGPEANFNESDDLGMMISIIGERQGGVFHRGEELLPIIEVDLETEYEPGTRFHRALTARAKLGNGEEHTVQGRVKGFIPLRNRRSGTTTFIGEGMTEYVLDGERVGYGLSEYLDQPQG